MKSQRLLITNGIDERQLALLIGTCLAVCQKVLQAHRQGDSDHVAAVDILHKTIKPEYSGEVAETQTTEGIEQNNQALAHTPTAGEKLLLTVEEAAEALGLGRTLVYKLIKHKQIASIKIGRTRRVPVQTLKEFIAHAVAVSKSEHEEVAV
jgi:excisionase family DNA binding protein